jgi:lysophospholipase L1-like esterase
MSLPNKPQVIVAFGDSITDGTGTTINGDDRWPDVLSRRLHTAYGDDFVVVNQGIGGNRVVGPDDYATKPIGGGPGALTRLERDIVSLPGVTTVIWLEGINDFGADTSAEAVMEGYNKGVTALRQKIPGVKIFVATLTPALNSTIASHGRPVVDAKRKALNEFFRGSKLFDGVIDFDKATLDPATGEVKVEFQPNSSTGGPGDKLHPNRAGYAAMANAIDLGMIAGRAK